MNQFLNLSSFAEQMLIHENACVAIRKDMPLDRAALIGRLGPLGRIQREDRVAERAHREVDEESFGRLGRPLRRDLLVDLARSGMAVLLVEDSGDEDLEDFADRVTLVMLTDFSEARLFTSIQHARAEQPASSRVVVARAAGRRGVIRWRGSAVGRGSG